jgi:hypothetical protein
MSLYEGLSLVLSTFGTIFTVYLGFRQLRQPAPAGAPVSAAPAPYPAPYPAPPVPGAGPRVYGTARVPGAAPAPPVSPAAPPWQAPYGAPRPPAAPYGPPQPVWAPPRVRPRAVTTASVLMFVAAALQPLAVLTYYGIEYAINAQRAAADLGAAGAVDVIFFGIVAVFCGILGILVARGNRAGAWLVWIFGVLGVPLAGLAALGLVLSLVAPAEEQDPAGLLVMVVVYLVVVSIALAASGALLLTTKSRSFFFKKA